MAKDPGSAAATKKHEETRKTNIVELGSLKEITLASIRKFIIASHEQMNAQMIAGDDEGAEATSKIIDRARKVQNELRRAKIKQLDNSKVIRELIAKFKTVNKDLDKEQAALKKLAKDLKKAAKVIGILEKIITKIA